MISPESNAALLDPADDTISPESNAELLDPTDNTALYGSSLSSALITIFRGNFCDVILPGRAGRDFARLMLPTERALNQQSLMTWFVLRLFADRSFSPDHLAKAIVIIRPETFIASGHSFVACRQ
jgi:hypothetical protein